MFLKAAFLAVIQGLTEYLPVSSTGHMILVDQFLQLSPDGNFSSAFEVIVQFPSILAVVLYFWKDLWPFAGDAKETRARLGMWVRIVVAFLPAAAVGVVAHDFIEARLLNPPTVAAALFVGGILLIVLERRKHISSVDHARSIPLGMAIGIGCIQCIAMIPGTSRSAATIIGAMLLGATRQAAAEFSFFLAIPTMVGATAYKVYKNGMSFSTEQWAAIGVGSVVSFVVSYAVVAFLMNYIRSRDFKVFGYYRIVLAIVVLLAGMSGLIHT